VTVYVVAALFELDVTVVQADPSFITIEYPLIGAPPSEAGAVQVSVTCWSPTCAPNPVTAPGLVDGMTAVPRVRGSPVPADEMPATRKRYDVPLVKPVTVAAPLGDPVSAIAVVQLVPLSVDTSMRCPVRVAELVPGVHDNNT